METVRTMFTRRTAGAIRGMAVLLLCATAVGSAQDRALPDPQPFLDDVRKQLRRDEALQSGYMYVETRRELKLDKSMRATKESISVIESYPGLPGEERWERVISEDGKPVP